MTATEERPSGEATRPHDGRSVGLALERVLRQYRGLVLHVSHGHGLDPADVDLILQEVRIRLWRAHPSSETLGRVGSSYVYRTAVSAALDILRRRRAARTGVEALSGLSDGLASGAAGPAQQLEARELEERVYATVERLPEARRAVVRMYLAG